MPIIYDPDAQIFHLHTNRTSYIFGIHRSYLSHLYWGQRIHTPRRSHLHEMRERAFCATPDSNDPSFSLDHLPQEFPGYGTSDFRHPVYQIQHENGTTITEFVYHTHRILPGKPDLEGLPATYAEQEQEAATLEVELRDPFSNLKAILTYTVFEDLDAITRSVRFVNESALNINLMRALSMSIDFHHAGFEMLHLSGSWAKERWIEKRPLKSGMQSIESRRGASSHQHNPFMALCTPQTNEDQGEVYGFSLVYSGNFAAQAEVDQFGTCRVSMGLNPFHFNWLLEPGSSFQTPEVVMVYSSEGLGRMSRTYHRLYRTRLCRGAFRDQARPVLANNWEATYFDFDAEKIESIARAGKELGIELFVLDDGWFGKRDNDKSSLGDWIVDRKKLPAGLDDLARRMNQLGLRFGLWFEPEMISPDSELYRAHPDWCLHVPDHRRTLSRSQLVLDMSREDVCDQVVKMVSDILASAPISYVKWDMNRHMTEIGSAALPPARQQETAHRYMLGLYRVMERITSAFPHILFESCSGGGGRFDPGMLYYMPQTWTSDDTDAIARLKIQYGTSLVYPASAMGSHVSAIPNHQVHRFTSLDIRGRVAMSGNFGYELDLTKFSEEEKRTVAEQVSLYKEIRPLVQFGDMYRLLSPFEGNETAWMFVNEEQTEAFVLYFKVLAEPNEPIRRLRLKGLNPAASYQLIENGELYGGDELIYAGIVIPPLAGDFQSISWRFRLDER